MRPRQVSAGGMCAVSFFALLGLPSEAAAQMPAVKPNRVTAGYFGESGKNPGASVGYETAFYYRRPHELFGGAHIGGYNSSDPSFYGLFIYLEGGYRLNFRAGFFIEARVGLGYVNITRQATTLTDDTGMMTIMPGTSSNFLMPLALGGLGWDFLPKTRVPLSLFADVGGMGRYNSTEPFDGGLIFTAGLAYQFGTGKPRMAEVPVPDPQPALAPPIVEVPPPGSPGAPVEVVPPPPPAPPAEPPQLPPPPTVPPAPTP